MKSSGFLLCGLGFLLAVLVSLFDRGTVSASRPWFAICAAHSRRQGWPQATAAAARSGLDDGEHGAMLLGRAGPRRDIAGRIGGELAWRGGRFKRAAATLYAGDLLRVGDHDAVMRIGGEAPNGGPILQQRHNGHGWVRDTAASDRHRQRLAERRTRPQRMISALPPQAPASSSSCLLKLLCFAQPATGAGCKRMPSGTAPVLTSCQNATNSLRASATIMTLRVSRRWSAVRLRYHITSALSG